MGAIAVSASFTSTNEGWIKERPAKNRGESTAEYSTQI